MTTPAFVVGSERYFRDWYSPHVNDLDAEIGVADAVFWASHDTVIRLGGFSGGEGR